MKLSLKSLRVSCLVPTQRVPSERHPVGSGKVFQLCVTSICNYSATKAQRKLWVDDLVICRLKADDEVNPVWEAQLLSHLKLTGKRLGFLIKFNASVIKKGIKRFVL